MNIGADLTLFNGYLNVIVDVFQRKTNNLLFNPALPATAGAAAALIVNIGKMKNTGFDFSVGHTGDRWNATFQGSHYKNEIVSIDGVQKFFYGLIATRFGNRRSTRSRSDRLVLRLQDERLLQHDAEVAACKAAASQRCKLGRIKFVDLNGDNKITADDRTIIGNPHPDFTGSLDLGYRYGNFDVSGTIFGSFGNEISTRRRSSTSSVSSRPTFATTCSKLLVADEHEREVSDHRHR